MAAWKVVTSFKKHLNDHHLLVVKKKLIPANKNLPQENNSLFNLLMKLPNPENVEEIEKFFPYGQSSPACTGYISDTINL